MYLPLFTTSLLSLSLYTSAAVCKTPELKYAFTAQVTLGTPIGPAPVAGGQTAGKSNLPRHITSYAKHLIQSNPLLAATLPVLSSRAPLSLAPLS
jgi:hypothetical protein